MAKYTTQIRYVVESGYPIFDFEYPIFDPAYKPLLEKKILDYYYFREIGFETIAQFKHFLKSRLNIIMPYYNQLYQTENLISKDDYNINMNTVETHTKTLTETRNLSEDTTVNVTGLNTEHSTGSGTEDRTEGVDNTHSQTTKNTDKYSDTPQGGMAVGTDYLTNMRVVDGTDNGTSSSDSTVAVDTTTLNDITQNTSQDSTGNVTNTGTVNTIEDYEIRLTGGGGVRYNSDVLMEWRKTFLNIDKQVIEELNDLFMNIY